VGMKKTRNMWLKIIGIALLHFVLNIIVFGIAFGNTMARFDNGLPASQTEQIVDLGAEILNFPLVTLASFTNLFSNFGSNFFSGFMGWLVFILNSLLWGTGIYMLGLFISKKLKQK
jgi:hypothetical protein